MLSSLYTWIPHRGTLPSSVRSNSTTIQVRHVTGLAAHPTSGGLGEVMSGQVNNVDCNEATLLLIDPASGVAAIVGTQGSLIGPVPDIAFDPFGTLYAWTENDRGREFKGATPSIAPPSFVVRSKWRPRQGAGSRLTLACSSS